MTRMLNMGLCAGRHEIPEAVDGYIFPSNYEFFMSKFGMETIEARAFYAIWDACFACHRQGLKGFLYSDPDGDIGDQYNLWIDKEVVLNLYVTGFTPALIAVLNVARQEGFTVICWHYDRENRTYVPQPVK